VTRVAKVRRAEAEKDGVELEETVRAVGLGSLTGKATFKASAHSRMCTAAWANERHA
jgi:hypothetical protein